MFLTLEGIEGAGKSTALHFIADYYREKNKDVLITREPGGTPIAEQIRQILLSSNADEKLLPETELLLMFAGRVQHIQHVILPALSAGKYVISDRFIDASFAYQGGGRGIDITHIEYLEKWLLSGLRPDFSILFDISPEIGLARAAQRCTQDRIEQEKKDFFQRVRAMYLKRAENDPKRFYKIDAVQPIEAIKNTLRKILPIN